MAAAGYPAQHHQRLPRQRRRYAPGLGELHAAGRSLRLRAFGVQDKKAGKDFVAGRVRPAVAEGALFRNPAPSRRTSKFDSPRYLRYEFNDKVDGQGLVLFCFPFDVVRPDESVREIMRRLAGR